VSCAKTVEQTEMASGMLSQMDPRNHALDGVEISPWEGAILRGKGMPRHA